ncbi:MAG: hypothetical protein KJO66_06940 [Gammaproteobacteria bacterium]|nr:hypothetical protein [Gammaproteobacteria bacterium]
MSQKDPIRVYVVHLFESDADYLRFFEYLENRENFIYVNVSQPDAMPPGGLDAMKEVLREQIEPAEIVVVPMVTYDRNEELAKFQMDVAQAARKPVLVLQSFGGTISLNKLVMDRADDVVEWNDRTITDAIRKLARGEDTSQWEVIEFDLD